MKNILERRLERQLSILNNLVYNNWMTTSLLAKKTNLSERTIRKDISEINDYIQPAEIETNYKFGIKITMPAKIGPSFLYSSLYKQSVSFLILEKLLTHEYSSLIQLSEKLFISESTIKREITRLNYTLQGYGFSINTSKVDIIGDEQRIDQFYYMYFLEKYDCLDAVVSSYELGLIDALIDEFFQQQPRLQEQRPTHFPQLNKVRIMLYVIIQRLKKKHEVPQKTTVQHVPQFSYILANKFRSYYGFSLSTSVIFQLFRYYLSTNSFSSYEQLKQAATGQPKTQLLFEQLTHCLKQIEQTQQLVIRNREEILLALFNLIRNTVGPTQIIHSQEAEFFSNLNLFYQKFTQEIQTIFEATLAPEIFQHSDQELVYKLIFILVTHWSDLTTQLEQRSHSLHTMLFFNTSYEHQLFLKQDIQHHLQQRLDIAISTDTTIEELRKSAANYDLIITNLSNLKQLTCPVVSIQTNPTIRDFENILIAYNQLTDLPVHDSTFMVQKANSIYRY